MTLRVVAAALFFLFGAVPESGEAGELAVEVRIHYSRFEPARLVVPSGTSVRFVIDNTDPINHELIVGPPELHRRHEAGAEPAHAPRPGEVTVPVLGSAETTYQFDQPGEVLFACHLPGHFAYGMHGTVVVR